MGKVRGRLLNGVKSSFSLCGDNGVLGWALEAKMPLKFISPYKAIS